MPAGADHPGGLGKKSIGILDVFQDCIADARIDGLIVESPAPRFDQAKLVDERVCFRRRVDVYTNNLRTSTTEDSKLSSDGYGVGGIFTAPASDVQNDRLRPGENPDTSIEGDCTVQIGESADSALGIKCIHVVHTERP